MAGPLSPGGTMIRRLRKTASAVGLAIGNTADSYDAGVRNLRVEANDDDDAEEDEGLVEGMKANGTRVWYR